MNPGLNGHKEAQKLLCQAGEKFPRAYRRLETLVYRTVFCASLRQFRIGGLV